MILVFLIILTIGLAAAINCFMNWWQKQPLKEEKETPFYITMTLFEE